MVNEKFKKKKQKDLGIEIALYAIFNSDFPAVTIPFSCVECVRCIIIGNIFISFFIFLMFNLRDLGANFRIEQSIPTLEKKRSNSLIEGHLVSIFNAMVCLKIFS